MLNLLKHTWDFAGLKAPSFIWLAAAALLLFTFGILGTFAWNAWRVRRRNRAVTVTLRSLAKEYPLAPRRGLANRAFDEAARAFDQISQLDRAWYDFRSRCIWRRSPEGEEEVWASEGADSAFSEAAVVDAQIDRHFYASIPGVVTSIGLLFTFLAILVALLDVHIENDQVKGLDLLIHGLSGKFVSSIVALFGATIYLLYERRLQHGLSRSRHELIASVDRLVPVLAASQILSDLTRDIGEQSTAFRSFNADLAQKLKQSFSESMGPTLERMVGATEDLTTLLRTAEDQKKESLSGSLETLMTRLQESVTASLSQVSNRFQESLSGGAMAQFEQVIGSLGEAGQVLARMNAQSEATQRMLGEVVNLARDSTAEQMRLGRTQVDELNSVLRALMVQLNESADSSVARMNAALTAVVSGLSQQVGELSDKMTSSVVETAGLATGAANDVIARASEWSSKSAEQLRKLLEEHHSQLDTIRGLRSSLEEALAGFNGALERYARVSSDLAPVAKEVGVVAAELGAAAKSARDTHEALDQVAALVKGEVEQLGLANRNQQDVWREIHGSMDRYQVLFAKVEAETGTLLAQIAQHLANYVQTSQRGFDGLVTAADEHFANATKRLGSSVSELDEVLQTLTDELSRRPHRPPEGAA